MSELPEIWWSPSRAAENKGVSPYAGMLWSHVSGRGYVTPRSLPADAVRVTVGREPAPVDWPGRFRAAADVAEARGWRALSAELGDIALNPPDVVEAIGRALLGEESQ